MFILPSKNASYIEFIDKFGAILDSQPYLNNLLFDIGLVKFDRNADDCVQGGGGLILAIFVRTYHVNDPITTVSKVLELRELSNN